MVGPGKNKYNYHSRNPRGINMHPVIERVTQEIIERSHPTRSAYLNYIDGIAKKGPIRSGMGCGNLAHG
jgi:phosphogluconate dehydratase